MILRDLVLICLLKKSVSYIHIYRHSVRHTASFEGAATKEQVFTSNMRILIVCNWEKHGIHTF